MSKRLLAAALLSTAVIFAGPIACSQIGQDSEAASTPGTGLGINPAWMDTSVKPGDDFYAYAIGKWQASAEIPADRTSVGATYMADQATEKHLDSLIKEIIDSTPEAGSDAAKIKDYYLSYFDTKAINAAGMAPIKPDLDRFAAIKDKAALAEAIGSQVRADVDPLNATNFHTGNLFGVFVTQALTGGQVVPYLLQGGLGMPDREYYLASGAEMQANRKAYRKYISAVLAAAGYGDAEAMAERVFALETNIANAHSTREESADWSRSTQLWSPAEFGRKAPGMDWTAFFKGSGLGKFDKIEAYHPDATARLSKLVASEPLEAWKDWLVFHQIDSNASVLPTKIGDLAFDFYGRTLSGAQAQRPRDKQALANVNGYLGDALGKLYVEKYFPASAKAEIEAMVGNIKQAFVDRIGKIDWMAKSTKAEAITKAYAIEVGVGYPDRWTDYSALKVTRDNPYANRQAARLFRYQQQLAKIGKPLDRREWWMNAQLVNAVNLPVQNAMNFPAAILQPPNFDPKADPAFNYGAIGATIGHEISHSFDDSGADFDSTGTMRNWWTASDKARFGQSGTALAAQYDLYKPFPDLAVNGNLTLGENIADVAGLAASYDAYRKSLGGKEAPVIGGLTGDQRFFIAYAQSWATKMRDEVLRQQIITDGHAPDKYRALTVRNIDAWYDAFGVKPGDALYLAPKDRVKVW